MSFSSCLNITISSIFGWNDITDEINIAYLIRSSLVWSANKVIGWEITGFQWVQKLKSKIKIIYQESIRINAKLAKIS